MRWKISGPAAALWLTTAVVAAFMAIPVAADNPRWGAGYFPNVTLTTEEGVDVRFYDDLVKGKIVAINLIYTTCKYACPLETARLAQVARVLGPRMGRDIFFYSISIDPDVDTPAVLKAYKEKYQIGPGWTFLTGKKQDIDLVSKKLGLYTEPDPSDPDGHLPYLLVGNEATGQWMDPGQYTFKNHCAACHTIGRGDQLGPDLLGVATTRDREWLTRFIVAPEKVRASGDPIALALRAKYKQIVMPSLDLDSADAALLIDYIDRESRAAGAATTGQAANAAPAAHVDLTPILNPYLRIQRALNIDTIAGIRSDARRIADLAATRGGGGAAMQAAAAELQQAADLPAARTAFALLSDAVIQYGREAAAGFGDEVKVAYCPMLRKYWLQKGDAIQNPFYGQPMSDCGRISATIPGQK